MRHEQPLLRTQLLTWLAVPLFLLLIADTFISYWVALSFSQRAYDRSLVEIAREVTGDMKQTLAVTEQATRGVNQTAATVADLAAQAANMKSSVARFKVA